jgi:hypothetical protein
VLEPSGGYATYGQDVGIIMLDCAFPRPVGDVGNARSFPFPVRYEVLEGIPAGDLTKREEPAAVAALLRAAQRLERAGTKVILTSCGLFLRYQARLAAAVSVPVATSSVLLLPFLTALFPAPQRIGVLTADAGSLAPVLARAAWHDPSRIVLASMDEGAVFRRTILEPVPPFHYDPAALEAEVLATARSLLDRQPPLTALLVECTNLSPYSPALRHALSRPVFDVLDVARLLRGAVHTQGWPGHPGGRPC